MIIEPRDRIIKYNKIKNKVKMKSNHLMYQNILTFSKNQLQ